MVRWPCRRIAASRVEAGREGLAMGDAAGGAEERKMVRGGHTICQRRCQLGSPTEELILVGRLARSPRAQPPELVPAVGHGSSPPEFITWRAKRSHP
jgi:hypothetical protein